jgi:hypothetical protein
LPAEWWVARGTFFEDAIALVMVPSTPQHHRWRPVSIPLTALIPKNTEGFLGVSYPGCEPVLRKWFQHPRAQWALGEAAGQVAASVAQVGGLKLLRQSPHWAWKLQQKLVRQGIPIFAFDDVPLDDPDFESIQMMAIADVVRTTRQRDLRFRPETPITRSVVASALSRLVSQKQLPPALHWEPDLPDVSRHHWALAAIQQAIALNLMSHEITERFAPHKVVTKRQLGAILRPFHSLSGNPCPFPEDDTPARRRHLSRALYPVLQSRWGS